MNVITTMARPDYQRVKRAVQDLLDEFGVESPPVDPVQIARDLGVRVKFVEFSRENDRISGFYDPEEHAIYVNKHEFPPRQTFTIAHELGHALLHKDWVKSEDYRILMRDDQTDHGEIHEKEANAFAAHLLVPRGMLDRYRNLSITDLSRLFTVSVPVIRNRMTIEYGA